MPPREPSPDGSPAPDADLWRAVRVAGGLWTWGDEEGIVPWADDEGREVVPLWTDRERAQSESRPTAEPGERAVFLDLEDLLAEVPGWLAAGIPAAGLQSEGGRFLLTLPLVELTERLLRLQAGEG